jgi:hypothetical protein
MLRPPASPFKPYSLLVKHECPILFRLPEKAGKFFSSPLALAIRGRCRTVLLPSTQLFSWLPCLGRMAQRQFWVPQPCGFQGADFDFFHSPLSCSKQTTSFPSFQCRLYPPIDYPTRIIILSERRESKDLSVCNLQHPHHLRYPEIPALLTLFSPL